MPQDTLDLIKKYESGGQNVPNYAFGPGRTAQGYYQITDQNWRNVAPQLGIDLSQYPSAMAAPEDVQRQVAQHLLSQPEGIRNWTDYNPRLAQAIGMPQEEEMQTVQGPDGKSYSFPKAQAKQAMTAMRRRATPEQLGVARPGAPPQLPTALRQEQAPGFMERTGRDIVESFPPVMAYRGLVKHEAPYDPRSGIGRGLERIQQGVTAFASPEQGGIQRGITNIIKGTGEAAQTPATLALLGTGIGALRSGGIGGLTREAGKMGVVGGATYGLGEAGEAFGKRMGWKPETQEMLGALGESVPIATLGFKPEWIGRPVEAVGRGVAKVAGSPLGRITLGYGLGKGLEAVGVPPPIAQGIGEGLGLTVGRYKTIKGALKGMTKEKVGDLIEYYGQRFRGQTPTVGAPTVTKPGPVAPPKTPPPLPPQAAAAPQEDLWSALQQRLQQHPESIVPTPPPAYAAPEVAPRTPARQAVSELERAQGNIPGRPSPAEQLRLGLEGQQPQQLSLGLQQVREAEKLAGPPPLPKTGQLTEAQQTQRTGNANKLADWAALHMHDLSEEMIRAQADVHAWRKALGHAVGLKYVPSKETVLQMIPRFNRLKEHLQEKIKEGALEFIDKRPDVITQPLKPQGPVAP